RRCCATPGACRPPRPPTSPSSSPTSPGTTASASIRPGRATATFCNGYLPPRIGVELAEERHSKGPVHDTGRVGGVVLEVYPLHEGGLPADASLLAAPPRTRATPSWTSPAWLRHPCPQNCQQGHVRLLYPSADGQRVRPG